MHPLSTRLDFIDVRAFILKLLRNEIKLLDQLRFCAPSRYPRASMTAITENGTWSQFNRRNPNPRLCKLLNGCHDLFDIHHDSMGRCLKILYNLLLCKQRKSSQSNKVSKDKYIIIAIFYWFEFLIQFIIKKIKYVNKFMKL